MALEPITAGPWSLLPALLAITLAWSTREALVGLFVGVASAGVVYGAYRPETVGVPADFAGGTMGSALGTVFGLTVVPTLVATAPLFGDARYVENVLIALFAIGGLIGLMIRSGAIQGVLEALAARADSAADAEKAAFLAGVTVHIDDYFNCLVVGVDAPSADRPLRRLARETRLLRRQRRVARGTTGLLLDVGRGDGRVHRRGPRRRRQPGVAPAGHDRLRRRVRRRRRRRHRTGLAALLQHALHRLLLVGRARRRGARRLAGRHQRLRDGHRVERRARRERSSETTTARCSSREMEQYEMYEGATPDWRNFAVPVATMVVVGLGAMFWRGSPVITVPGERGTPLSALLGVDPTLSALGAELTPLSPLGYQVVIPPAGPWALNIGGVKLGLAATTALVVGFALYRLRGDVPSNDDGVDAVVRGMKGIFLAAAILTFATAIQNSVTTLGISSFVTDWFSGVPAAYVPLFVFLATSFVSFSDGSSWSTYGIMFPIAIPVAFVTGANLPLVLGAVFSGGIFGDHTSPISDTTVLASSTSGSDHLVHVRSQLPYALASAGVAALAFLLAGFLLPQGFRLVPY